MVEIKEYIIIGIGVVLGAIQYLFRRTLEKIDHRLDDHDQRIGTVETELKLNSQADRMFRENMIERMEHLNISINSKFDNLAKEIKELKQEVKDGKSN